MSPERKMGLSGLDCATIRMGDFHVHTAHTDGRNTIREYCEQARRNGLAAIAFTEHVRRDIRYSYGRFLSEIAEARLEFPDLSVLSGCEAKVLDIRGNLDAPEEALASCDLVVGVFHSFAPIDKVAYLTALRAMLANAAIDVWGHPTLFLRRHSMSLEKGVVVELVEICAEQGVLIENNLKHQVPDSALLRLALERGVGLLVGSDAHSVEELATSRMLTQTWGSLCPTY